MFFEAALIGLVFVEPSYYRLKANGYRPSLFIWPTLVVSACIFLVTVLLQAHYWLIVLPAILLRVLASSLPVQEGAPGHAYLKINFPCSHCGHQLEIGRRSEGGTWLCPRCSEITPIPNDEKGAHDVEPDTNALEAIKSAGTTPITLLRCLNPFSANMVRARIESGGINTFIADENMAYVHPGVSLAGGGVRVMIPAESVEDAVSLLSPSCQFEPVEDAAIVPSEPEIESDGFGLMLFDILILLVFLPFILITLWSWTIPLLFRHAVAEGVLPSKLAPDIALWFTLIAILIRVASNYRPFQRSVLRADSDNSK